MNVIGHILLLLPLVGLFWWIPLVGQLLAYGLGMAIIIFGIVWSTLLHCIVIGSAYVYYRPKIGIPLLAVAIVCIGLLFV